MTRRGACDLRDAAGGRRGRGDSHESRGAIRRRRGTWQAHWDDSVGKDRASRVTYELSPAGASTTKLRVVHNDFDGQTAPYTGSTAAGL
jgi:hypothetical protein